MTNSVQEPSPGGRPLREGDSIPPAETAPVDLEMIRATVDRALAQGPVPPHRELVELEELLRGHIGMLLPLAETAVGKLWRGGVEWYGKRAWLDIARDRVGMGLGHGTAAHTHIRLLGHDCRALLRYADADR